MIVYISTLAKDLATCLSINTFVDVTHGPLQINLCFDMWAYSMVYGSIHLCLEFVTRSIKKYASVYGLIHICSIISVYL